jgi:hypothetical protein
MRIPSTSGVRRDAVSAMDILFARVQLLFKFFWRDSRHSRFAHKATPSNQLAADEYGQRGERKKDPKRA